ncbi:unnamed protein product [Cyclocybe aegerita]|uniref:Uncharacterized protein n=1 Tax=Cyclocybe aegerita TaxID=1973307 RepID=A0A8S0VXU5_CYCAE|nr:unnamed protein product [Cyclocybe aegerita]
MGVVASKEVVNVEGEGVSSFVWCNNKTFLHYNHILQNAVPKTYDGQLWMQDEQRLYVLEPPPIYATHEDLSKLATVDHLQRLLNLNGPTKYSMERSLSEHEITDDEDRRSQHFLPSSLGGPWSNSRILSSNRGQPVPIRSSSFSAHPQNQFSSAMRERAFPSTFEDDESEALSDTYDERYVPPSMGRGRTYGQDPSRSRSQSLATTRPGPVGSPYLGSSAMQSWNESYLSTNPLKIPSSGQRFGEMKPPGASRYGSLGAIGRSPTNIHSSSPTGGSLVGNGYGRHQQADISNMSPFVRDVGQILLDDGSAFRELWAGMNPPRDENGGGGSGTTSRRHSVSVVQPRRGNVVGFNAPGTDVDEPPRANFQSAYSGRSGLMLSDDDLASDLGLLNINPNEPPQPSLQHPPSQPSSLPIYAPLSRSPPSRDLMSNYHLPRGKKTFDCHFLIVLQCRPTAATTDQMRTRQQFRKIPVSVAEALRHYAKAQTDGIDSALSLAFTLAATAAAQDVPQLDPFADPNHDSRNLLRYIASNGLTAVGFSGMLVVAVLQTWCMKRWGARWIAAMPIAAYFFALGLSFRLGWRCTPTPGHSISPCIFL